MRADCSTRSRHARESGNRLSGSISSKNNRCLLLSPHKNTHPYLSPLFLLIAYSLWQTNILSLMKKYLPHENLFKDDSPEIPILSNVFLPFEELHPQNTIYKVNQQYPIFDYFKTINYIPYNTHKIILILPL
jgi:hypothetical protein